jgi:hypothetical protein
VLTITPAEPLPKHSTYEDDKLARAFWRLSFHCGRKYVDGLDAMGRPVLPQHEREREGYTRRKQLTKPQNHAGPIIRRYNDHAFRRPAQRATKDVDALYTLLMADADGRGTPLPVLMKRATRQAQVEREAYLLPDSTKPADAGAMTKAQAAAAKVRPFIRRIGADDVVWWRDYDGAMVEALVLLCREDGTLFARHFTAADYRDVEFKITDGKVDDKLTVASVGTPVAHPFGGCPLVRLRPEFSDDDEGAEAQISPLAEIQQAITWHISLLNEEIGNVTFSQMVVMGVSAEQVKGTEIGNNRLLCIPNPQGSMEVIGADPAQAATIETRITNDIRELYRIAGVDAGSSTDGPGNPESGLAKAFRHNDLAANLGALAQSAETAENAVMVRLFTGAGKPAPPPVLYPTEFDLPSLGDELNEAIQVAVTSQLPALIRQKVLARFAARNLQLSTEESAELGTQLDALETAPEPVDPPAEPQPGT